MTEETTYVQFFSSKVKHIHFFFFQFKTIILTDMPPRCTFGILKHLCLYETLKAFARQRICQFPFQQNTKFGGSSLERLDGCGPSTGRSFNGKISEKDTTRTRIINNTAITKDEKKFFEIQATFYSIRGTRRVRNGFLKYHILTMK